MPRVLHILSQRPSLTGSGVTLDALVRHAAAADWEQCVVAGVPAGEPLPDVGGLDAKLVKPLFFGVGESGGNTGGLPFPVPGMSDVMPYASTRFRDMTPVMIDAYKEAWKRHVQSVIESFRPDVIHSHHVWILSSLLKNVAPHTPMVTHCHATGLRQMEFCPHLAGSVKQGCSRNDCFAVLHSGHARALTEALGIPGDRVRVVGAGFREDLFHARGADEANRKNRLLYIGKYAAAKGLPWLLDAVERLAMKEPGLELHVAGTGSGPEAGALRGRMESMAPLVRLHGQLGQPELASLMRQCAACVLPSFYEGLPLVLVEALACGCRLVSTALPGVVEQLAPRFGQALDLVPLPRLEEVDQPAAGDLPAFVDHLEAALEAALQKPPLGDPAVAMPGALEKFTWKAVFERVEALWRELIEEAGREAG